MNKIILFLAVMAMGLSADAFQWTDLLYRPTPAYSPYSTYSPYTQNSLYPQSVQTVPGANYSITQPYTQTYNQGYYQNPYQNQYAQQYQGQSMYPYQYQNGYANVPYGVVNSAVSGLGTTNGTGQIVKNIGQSVIYSMMRGY